MNFNLIRNTITLFAALITIFNFLLALPSIFENLESPEITRITKDNFSLKVGFILMLEAGLAYIITTLLSYFSRIQNPLAFHFISIILILISAWLTFFNISEILYTDKLITTYEHLGMLFFISLSLTLQVWLLKEMRINYYYEKDFPLQLTYIILLCAFELIFFVVYWIN